MAAATERLITVLEEIAEVNPDIRRARVSRVNVLPDICPIPLLDPSSGVLTRSFLYLRWGEKLAFAAEER